MLDDFWMKGYVSVLALWKDVQKVHPIHEYNSARTQKKPDGNTKVDLFGVCQYTMFR